MGVVLSTAPPAFGFSKDLLSAFFTCDDYALKTNYAIHFKLFLEKADYSGYDEIYDTRLYLLPGSSGQVEAVIADKLHDAISADIAKLHPDIPDQGQALVCQKSCRKYYFQYREVHDGSDGPLVLFNTSPTYTILHGGLSFRAQFSTTLANLLQPAAPAQDRFLKQGNVNCYTRTNQPQYLYFFNGRDFSGSTELRVKYFYDDNTEGTGVLHSFSMQAFRKYAFHVGYSSLSPASNKRLVKYEVWLQQGSNKRSETRTYLMNYQIRDYVRYFLNWSSWGGLDTRLCYGQGNAEFELFQKEAKKQLKQGFDIKSGQYTVYDVYGQSQFTVATGWMSREDLIHFRDFYLSSIKYRYVGGLLMPIQVTSRNITELSDGNHLHAQEFQYRYLYDDHAYTEGDIEEPGQGFGDFFFSSGPVDNPTGGYTETDPTVPYWVKQITLDDIVKWNAGASFNPSDYLTQTTADGRYVTQATEQLSLPGNKGWTGRHHFSGALSLPQSAPVAPVSGETYIWFGNPGGGTTPPPAYGNLEDLQNVADVIDDGKYIQKVGGEWKGVDITFPDLSSYAQIGTGAGQVRNNTQLDARYAAISHTHTIAQVTGLQSQLDGFAVRAADNNFTARNHFSGALSIPQAAPVAPVSGETYIWFGNPGGGTTPPPAYGNLEDLQNVADVIDDGKYIQKVGGEWKGVDITFPDLSSYAQIGTGAGQVRNNTQLDARYAPVSHTHTIAQVTGLQSQLDGFAVRAADNNFTARNHFSGALSIPQAAPASPVAGQAYVWFGEPGTGSGGGVEISNLEDLQNVADVIADGKYLRKVSGEWQGVDITFPDLSSYAPKAWVTAGFAPIAHTHSISQITGLQTQLDGKAALSHTHNASDINAGTLGIARIPTGTTSSTVAIGNDSRIVNGQTAYGWGNHGLAGYAVRAANNNFTARNHFSGALSIPQAAPASPVAGQSYIWFGAPGSGGGGGTSGTLAGLDDVALSSLANNQLIRYNSSTGKWVNFTANYAAASHTHPISQITGLQSALDGKEPAFSKNTGFNRPFGTTANTVAQGNDARINNGQTAFGWGDFRPFGLGVTGNSMTGWPNSVADLDSTTTANGMYYFGTTAIGNPTGSDNSGSVIIQRATNGYYTQLAQPIHASTSAGDVRLFARHRTTSAWTPWVQFWHSGNLANGNTNQYIRGNGSLATFPTIGTGTLSLSTGTGLQGSASFGANQTGNTSFTVSAASGYAIPTNTQIGNWNAAYSYSQIGHLNNSGGNVTRTIAGWPTSTVSSNTNYIERRIISLVSSNNGLHFFGNGTSNARRFGIQSAHNNSQFSTAYGILELNPYGGEVRVNGGAVWHSGNIDPVPTSRQINTGSHLTGGGNLSANRTLSVAFTASTWMVDSQGNDRMYFGSSGTNTQWIVRASRATGTFQFRNLANSTLVSIDVSSGKITCPVIEPSAIIVPSAAPSSPESGKRYIWFS